MRGALLLVAVAAPLAAQDHRAGLLAADRSVAEASGRCGVGCALAAAMTPDGLYLHPGLPVLQGADLIGRFLREEPGLAPLRVQWQPLHGEVSGDATFGITWGTTATGRRGDPVRFGHYLTAWRRSDDGWRIVAHVQTALGEPGVRLPEWGIPTPDPMPADPVLAPFVVADREFAALAGREGAALAFGTFAAADAVAFAGTGELTRGPDAIRASMAAGPPAQWVWEPIAVRGADDGSLGMTVGLAAITVARPGAQPAAIYSKYLTAWRREATGSIRFIADAGNARPAP